MGFVQSTSDSCIYADEGGDLFFIGVYVDDIVVAVPSQERIRNVKEILSPKFDIKDIDKLHYFLVIEVLQQQKTGDIWIGQPNYTENLQRNVICKIQSL